MRVAVIRSFQFSMFNAVFSSTSISSTKYTSPLSLTSYPKVALNILDSTQREQIMVALTALEVIGVNWTVAPTSGMTVPMTQLYSSSDDLLESFTWGVLVTKLRQHHQFDEVTVVDRQHNCRNYSSTSEQEIISM